MDNRTRTGSLEWISPEIQGVYSQMLNFSEIPKALVWQAWDLLTGWAEEVWRETGQVIPAPGVLSGTDGIVEFEWEVWKRERWKRSLQRSLRVGIDGRDVVQYSLQDRDDSSQDGEGCVQPSSVPLFLKWLMG